MKFPKIPLYVSLSKEMEDQYTDVTRRRFMPFFRGCLIVSLVLEILEAFQSYYSMGIVSLLELRLIMMGFYTLLFAASYIPGAVRCVHILGVVGVVGVIYSLAYAASFTEDGIERFLGAFLIPLQLIPVMTSFPAALATLWLSICIIHDFASRGDLTYYAMTNVKNVLMYYGFMSICISYIATQYRRSSFKMEKNLEQARKDAEDANAAKSTFLATMSHEVRTPLNGILGLVTLVKDTKLDEQQKDYIETIKYSGEALLTILNDILDFSKMEAGKFELEEIGFDVRHLVKSVMTLMKSRAEEKGLQLNYKINPNVPIHISSDPTRIRQVLLNLVSNAIKFTDTGFVHVHVSCSNPSGADAIVQFKVRDSGIGIPPETQKNLFQEFVQADSSTSRKYGGTGLGLAICQKIVTLMKGEIGVISKDGEGSAFWFEVPVRISDVPAMPAFRQMEGESVPAFHPLHVLVAEDNKINQKVIGGLLERCGHSVTFAHNGREALEFLQKAEIVYDLALMDVQMPVMDGFTATMKIRALENKNKKIPVIALTANNIKGDEQRCLTASMDGYITKPIDPMALYKAIAIQVPRAVITGKTQKIYAVATMTKPGFENLMQLERRMGREYVKKFAEEGLIEVEHLIEVVCTDGDAKSVRRAAHDLKTIGSMFGLNDVHALAEGIEICCSENSTDEVVALGKLLHDRYSKDVFALRHHYLSAI